MRVAKGLVMVGEGRVKWVVCVRGVGGGSGVVVVECGGEVMEGGGGGVKGG